ncbi:MAG: 4'-phosphopantetheinyl transferase superfamily protein [Moraxellaceae bacterium]|nr:MAG: 4'-phosphopantetheinyl transferase superfamily protein [Moraxellaceae bacterium]
MRNKNEFIASRAFLRLCLARYASNSPEKLIFAHEPAGKPYLLGVDFPLYFNLSHSKNFMALGVSKHTPIGIDIEVSKKRNIMDVAERYFHHEEITRLRNCDPTTQQQLFFSLWTLKEALFKALGSGIVTGLEKASFEVSPGKVSVKFSPELKLNDNEWKFHYSTPTQGVHIALACRCANQLNIRWFNGADLFSTIL